MDQDSIDYQKLLREAFWDYDFTIEDLFRTAQSDDFREKKHLFEKILINSSDSVRCISVLFNKEDIAPLFNSITINRFNRHAERKIQLAKYFLLDKSIRIKELEWEKI